MSRIPVRFVYETAVRRKLFHTNLWLHGNWAHNRLSNEWTNTKMDCVTGVDGCPAYTAVVEFESDQVGTWFAWGVGAGTDWPDNWLIMTEVKDVQSTDRLRWFELESGDNSDQVYRLSVSRWLGAQKYFPSGGEEGQLRFAVWAPKAQMVEVVFGRLWLEPDQQSNTSFNLPGNTTASAPVKTIRGGYIANDGDGVVPGNQHVIPMVKRTDGVWVSTPAAPLPFGHFDHRPYMYRVKREDGSVEYRTDIHSRCQIGGGNEDPGGAHFSGATMTLDGGKSCSVVVDPDTVTKEEMISIKPERLWPEKFIDHDEFWGGLERPAHVAGLTYPGRVEDLVIYELHLGALGFGHEGPGTLDDALGLLDHFGQLGVNAIELLPLSEFGGGGENWGYATSHYYAIEYSGGGRDHLKLFIRECHRRGIAVIMDVVYNHFAHDADRAEWLYDTADHGNNCYYWYEGQPSDYGAYDAADPDKRGHGGYLDNLSTNYAPRYWEEIVRQTLISSAVVLAEEFHIDGFRVDQTTSIHGYNVLHADNRRPVPHANIFGAKLLREFSRTLRTIRNDIVLMAEDHSTWDAVTRPVDDRDGLGFDAVWYADYHHHLVGRNYGTDYAKLIPTAAYGTDIPLAIDWFAGALRASGQRKIVFHTSHDEAGNADKDSSDPDKRTHRTIVVAVRADQDDVISGLTREYAEARCRFAAGVTLLSAGTPLILFGEEVGFQKDFKYNAVLSHREDLCGYRDDEARGKFLFKFYRDLIRLRLGNAGLRSRDISILHVHNDNRVVVFRRWGGGQEFLVLASLNNRPFNNPGYVVLHPDIWGGSRWREIFNSDAGFYRGNDVGNFGATLTAQPGRFEAVIPANGFVVFARE